MTDKEKAVKVKKQIDIIKEYHEKLIEPFDIFFLFPKYKDMKYSCDNNYWVSFSYVDYYTFRKTISKNNQMPMLRGIHLNYYAKNADYYRKKINDLEYMKARQDALLAKYPEIFVLKQKQDCYQTGGLALLRKALC